MINEARLISVSKLNQDKIRLCYNHYYDPLQSSSRIVTQEIKCK